MAVACGQGELGRYPAVRNGQKASPCGVISDSWIFQVIFQDDDEIESGPRNVKQEQQKKPCHFLPRVGFLPLTSANCYLIAEPEL